MMLYCQPPLKYILISVSNIYIIWEEKTSGTDPYCCNHDDPGPLTLYYRVFVWYTSTNSDTLWLYQSWTDSKTMDDWAKTKPLCHKMTTNFYIFLSHIVSRLITRAFDFLSHLLILSIFGLCLYLWSFLCLCDIFFVSVSLNSSSVYLRLVSVWYLQGILNSSGLFRFLCGHFIYFNSQFRQDFRGHWPRAQQAHLLMHPWLDEIKK